MTIVLGAFALLMPNARRIARQLRHGLWLRRPSLGPGAAPAGRVGTALITGALL